MTPDDTQTQTGTPSQRGVPALDPMCALFLDIDGTLCEIAPTPSEVRVDPHVASLLPALYEALGGACALVTGRSVTDVDKILPGLRMPISGQHGCERRDADGKLNLHAKDRAMLDRLRTLFSEFARSHPGFLLEDKGATLALHYRKAPHLADHVRRTLADVLAAQPGHGYLVQSGKALVEVRPGSRDKGTSIRDFMREAPFAGRCPFFLGDDVGDEHGFDIVQRLGGAGIKVGPGHTRARYRLPDVAAVRNWLDAFFSPSPALPRGAATTPTRT